MVVLPFSLFSFYYLFILPPVATKKKKNGRRRRRRRREIILLTLSYKGLRDLKFWALNLGLPHEEKPNTIDTETLEIRWERHNLGGMGLSNPICG